jgi:hypothetical protein
VLPHPRHAPKTAPDLLLELMAACQEQCDQGAPGDLASSHGGGTGSHSHVLAVEGLSCKKPVFLHVSILCFLQVSTLDWACAERVYNLCEVLFKVHKVGDSTQMPQRNKMTQGLQLQGSLFTEGHKTAKCPNPLPPSAVLASCSRSMDGGVVCVCMCVFCVYLCVVCVLRRFVC